MLEPWIIEQIRRREEEERRGHQRPRLEIPTRDEREGWRDPSSDRHPGDKERRQDRDSERDDGSRDRPGPNRDDQPERGVTIIDYGVA